MAGFWETLRAWLANEEPVDTAAHVGSEAVICHGCGCDCRDMNWKTGNVVECDACNSKHFNCAIGSDMDTADAPTDAPSDVYSRFPVVRNATGGKG